MKGDPVTRVQLMEHLSELRYLCHQLQYFAKSHAGPR